MARIESMPGVLAAWTDRMGGVLVIATLGEPRDAERIVFRELAGRSTVERLEGEPAARAIRGCLGREPGWFRASEVNALSREEARVLALRAAERAARVAGLDDGQRERLETLVREALVRVFEEHARRKHFDGRRLDRELADEVGRDLSRLDLDAEKRERLRAAIEAEVR